MVSLVQPELFKALTGDAGLEVRAVVNQYLMIVRLKYGAGGHAGFDKVWACAKNGNDLLIYDCKMQL